MMKRYDIIFLLTILTACSSNKQEKKNDSDTSDTTTNIQSKNHSLDVQPVKTIIDFLNWYSDNQEIQGNLATNANGDTDSTKYYSVDFSATEKYLTQLKTTGFISEEYVNRWNEYFKKCDKDFKSNPSNDGPPEGFEYDFIMLSQEYDEDLQNIEKTSIVSQSILNDNATIKLSFPSGNSLIYKLTKNGNKWVIDDIERE